MLEPTTNDTARASRERWIVGACIVLLVVARSAVFVFWEESQFDSDQAVMGLAAKHLSEFRAFPVFFYGSNHILAVEAWLAAPLFLLFGVSVTALKLPLLVINIAIALLLLRLLERDVGLRPALALVPALFFVLPAPGTAAQLLDASGGNVEPFLYALLLWQFRNRPVPAGLVFAVGFLQREFTLYALLALVTIESCNGKLFTRQGARARLAMLAISATVWLAVQGLKYFGSPAGPGTTLASIESHSNLQELSNRFCFDLTTVPGGAWRMVTEHWPRLFGVHVQPLLDFAVDSHIRQGMRLGWTLLAASMLAAAWGVARRLGAERRWDARYDFCAYLVLVGLFSAAGLAVARCGNVDVMRYDFLSILAAVGLGAWVLCAQPGRLFRAVWMALACGTIAIGTTASARLLAEYLTSRHIGAKRQIARNLEVRDIRYASSDYWLAYSLTFLTNERVIVASEDLVRIEVYQQAIEKHRDEAVRVSRAPCPGGTPVAGIYLCK